MISVLSRIERHARLCPRSIAIESNLVRITYDDLVVAIDEMAQRLLQTGVKSLGCFLDNGIDWIVIDLACLKANIGMIPLPAFFSQQQIQHAIKDGAVDHLVFEHSLPRGIACNEMPVELNATCRLQPIETGGVTTNRGYKLSYTSGTTGQPKGIELKPSFLDQTCESLCEVLSGLEIERHLSVLPYATLLENIAGIYVPLMLGKTVFAEPSAQLGLSDDLQLDPYQLQQTFNRVRPQSLILTPQLLKLFCALVEAGDIDPKCLRFVAVGGATVGIGLLMTARELGIPAYEGYGLTEFGSVAILNTPGCDRPGSVGMPLPGVEVSLGEDNEICLCTTVLNNDEQDGKLEIVTVNTGDFGHIDADGYVYVHGRKMNRIVLSNGRNVAPEWVETELNTSPLIQQSFVYCEVGSELSALIFCASEDPRIADLEGEISRINASLPSYARVRNWSQMTHPFSRENAMLTLNGRLKRNAIKQALPDLVAAARIHSWVIPATPFFKPMQEKRAC